MNEIRKTALITGANRGIGKAIALGLAKSGYNLYLLARQENALREVASACVNEGVRAEYQAGELSSGNYIDSAVETAIGMFDQIDVLVNNAGVANVQAVQDADLDVWRSVMDVNFNATVHLSKSVLPAMIARRSGSIINISSISGRNTNAGSAIYAASKHALNGFSGCMFEDVRDFGVKVTTIMPGFVATDLTNDLGMHTDNMIDPEDVADCVMYALSASASCCPTEIVLRPQKNLQ